MTAADPEGRIRHLLDVMHKTFDTDGVTPIAVGMVATADGLGQVEYVDSATFGTDLTIEDEGSPLATAATSIDFAGAGVTASGTGAAKTVMIPGTPTGTAGGDLSGTYPNPSVVDDSHSHTSATLPAAISQHILLADSRATPFAFNDLLQADDGSDFLWSD